MAESPELFTNPLFEAYSLADASNMSISDLYDLDIEEYIMLGIYQSEKEKYIKSKTPKFDENGEVSKWLNAKH